MLNLEPTQVIEPGQSEGDVFDELMAIAEPATQKDIETMKSREVEGSEEAQVPDPSEGKPEGYNLQDYQGEASPEFDKLFGEFMGEKGDQTDAQASKPTDQKPDDASEGTAEAKSGSESAKSDSAAQEGSEKQGLSQSEYEALSEATGHTLKTVDDVQQLVTTALAERDVAAAITQLRGQFPQIDSMLLAMANGEDLTNAVLEGFPELQLREEDAIDEDDRDSLKRYYTAKGRQDKKAEDAATQAATDAKRQQRLAASAERLFQAVVKDEGLDETEAQSFARFTQELYGNGQSGEEVHARLYRAAYREWKHKEIMAAAIEKAKIDGRNEAIAQLRGKRANHGGEVPFITGGGGAAPRDSRPQEDVVVDRVLGSGGPVPDILRQFQGTA